MFIFLPFTDVNNTWFKCGNFINKIKIKNTHMDPNKVLQYKQRVNMTNDNDTEKSVNISVVNKEAVQISQGLWGT